MPPNENRQRMFCEEGSILLKNSIMWETLIFWLNSSVQYLIVINPSDWPFLHWLNRDLPRHWRAQNTRLLHFRSEIYDDKSFLGFLYLKYEISECWQRHRSTNIHENNLSSLENRNWTTGCPCKIEKKLFFGHTLVVETDVVLYDDMWASFSGCSLWWRKYSQNLPLLCLGTMLGAGRIRNWLFVPCSRE